MSFSEYFLEKESTGYFEKFDLDINLNLNHAKMTDTTLVNPFVAEELDGEYSYITVDTVSEA